jgi:hypothetical protein
LLARQRRLADLFLVVGLAGLRLRAETGSKTCVILLTMAATAVVLVLFRIDTARNAPQTFGAMIGLVVLAVVLDLVWKRIRARRDETPMTAPPGPERWRRPPAVGR